MVAGLYRGEVASTEHASLLAHALSRNAVAAQATLSKHVHDCVAHIVGAGLLGQDQ
jgi:hypothetical protein